MAAPRLRRSAFLYLVAATVAATAPSGVARADDPTRAASLVIEPLEGPNTQAFTAPDKPRAIRLRKPVPWTKHKDSKSDRPMLWFSAAEGRVLTIELAFDGTRSATDVHATYAVPLMRLAMIRNPTVSAPEEEKRPARVKVTYGPLVFEGVIEDVAMEYTAFADDGSPRQATATVTLREASRAIFKRGS